MATHINDLVFVGFHSQVAALHRESGQPVWKWKSRKGTGYVAVLLDGDRLVVSVMGYTYCLEPETGRELWFNELPGTGAGVASLTSVRGNMSALLSQAAAQAEEQQSHATAASTIQ